MGTTPAAIRMYDLAGRDEGLRFSPFCWRARLAIARKRLPLETMPWRFTEKARIAEFGSERVPVIIDGDKVVADSWLIAEYLEDAYPGRPCLFGGVIGKALARVVVNWTELVLHPAILRAKIGDLYSVIHDKDRDYFRQSREARLGRTLDELVAEAPAAVAAVASVLEPIRRTLKDQPYLSGPEPLFADHVVCGALQWMRLVGGADVLGPDDPVLAWQRKVLERYEADLRAI